MKSACSNPGLHRLYLTSPCQIAIAHAVLFALAPRGRVANVVGFAQILQACRHHDVTHKYLPVYYSREAGR